MFKYSYIIVLIFTLFACQQNKKKHNSAIKVIEEPAKDTLKIEWYSPISPNDRLFIEYFNSYYGDSANIIGSNNAFKTLKLNILYNTQRQLNSHYYRIDSVNKRSYFKTLYTTSIADSLMLKYCLIETAKQNRELYINVVYLSNIYILLYTILYNFLGL